VKFSVRHRQSMFWTEKALFLKKISGNVLRRKRRKKRQKYKKAVVYKCYDLYYSGPKFGRSESMAFVTDF
jgi:hypothetical protein